MPSCLVLVYVCYTITGFDASAHTSEETQDAQVNVPKGMWQAVFWSWVFGLVAVAAYVLTMPRYKGGGVAGWGSFDYMWNASTHAAVAQGVPGVGLVAVNYICALAGLTSTSRMMYAFSRDGGLPASKSLSQCQHHSIAPRHIAIWTSAALALLSTVYAPYYLVLAVACAVFLYISMIMPIAAGLRAEGRTEMAGEGAFQPWRVSPSPMPSSPLSLVSYWRSPAFFPPNEKVFHLTIILIVALLAFWSRQTAIIGIVRCRGRPDLGLCRRS